MLSNFSHLCWTHCLASAINRTWSILRIKVRIMRNKKYLHMQMESIQPRIIYSSDLSALMMIILVSSLS